MRLRAWSSFSAATLVSAVAVPLALGACRVDNAADGGNEPVGRAEEAVSVCAGPKTLQGIDVSHYDGTIDWAKVKMSGRAFAFAKATEGTTYVDPDFATNWAQMAQHGVVRSAYHFFHANMDPIVEADHFLQVMGPLQPGDLPPTLDLEVTDNQSAATITTNTIKWLDHVAAATGTKPILYSSPSFISGTLGSPAGLENHAQLWVANWGVNCPNVPAPFTSWPFWQYSATGTVPGISGSGNVDLDEFNGDMTALTALTKPPPSTGATTSSTTTSTGATGAGATSSAAGGTTATGTGAGTTSATGAGATSTTGAGGGGGAGGSGSGASHGCHCATAGDGGDGASKAAWLLGLGVAFAARRKRARG